MDIDDARHGTHAGYQAHRRDGEDACDACKVGARDYMRDFRGKRDRADEQRRSRVRTRVLWRLAALYRDEYDRLYREEIRREFLGEAS